MGSRWWALAVLGTVAVLWGFSTGEAVGEETLPMFSQMPSTAGQETTLLQDVEFPFVLRGTGLIVQQLVHYEGPFPEDGSQEPMANVAALMIYNPGSRAVTSGELMLTQGEELLRFSFTFLPAGSRMLVLENKGKSYSREAVTDCSYTRLTETQWGMAEDKVRITEEEGHLTVKNLSGEELSVTLYYKQYISDGDFYLGGLTKSCRLEHLTAGESRSVLPELYAPGYSKIVAVMPEKP